MKKSKLDEFATEELEFIFNNIKELEEEFNEMKEDAKELSQSILDFAKQTVDMYKIFGGYSKHYDKMLIERRVLKKTKSDAKGLNKSERKETFLRNIQDFKEVEKLSESEIKEIFLNKLQSLKELKNINDSKGRKLLIKQADTLSNTFIEQSLKFKEISETLRKLPNNIFEGCSGLSERCLQMSLKFKKDSEKYKITSMRFNNIKC